MSTFNQTHISTTTTFHFDWFDRLKLLLGWTLQVSIESAVREDDTTKDLIVGPHTTRVTLVRPMWWPRPRLTTGALESHKLNDERAAVRLLKEPIPPEHIVDTSSTTSLEHE